jgi:two-component system sensor histidine kinase DesK
VAADELRVELATSEERESVARDVHDLLGHSLTVVKLKAELAARLVDRDPDRARAELAEIVRLTGEAISGVRGTVTGLRADGLAAQVQASRAALDSAGISAEVAGDAGAISPAQSLPASWILREATTNILRHAHAKHVRIGIEPGTVIVEDDGVGIRAKAGNGLRGMAERAAAADAVLRVERSSAGGTRVSVTW